ncbi:MULTISPECIES: secA translation cis-regulator SecM [Erwinia]|uniref:secA translation cis-regulator SecM n=1 Tax=Erwinia TaxID=551 RepID=UPI0005575BBC|nr:MULTISPECIES: secA translation cis-regulator SecM [Erwinia]
MIGILNRWRQFGRRYFWPHLLLGMVAASIGAPHTFASEQATLPETSTRSLNIGSVVRFDGLALLQESTRRSGVNVDYWHQHAIRTVIRHLTFTLAPVRDPIAQQTLNVQKLVLLDTLSTLLTHEARPPVIVRQTAQPLLATGTQWQTGLWLAQVQGIRAGPFSLT